MYILKSTRTTNKTACDRYIPKVNKRVEYKVYTKKGYDWQSPLSQKEIKALFLILPKDKTAERTTGGGIHLEYTKTI